MRRKLLLLAAAAALAAGCSRQVAAPEAVATDTRPLMPQVTALDVAPATGGVIVRATGLPPVQGYWDGALVPVETAGPGVLAFAFHALPPPAPTRVSTVPSRYVEVATFVPDARLAGIREIRVAGAANVRAARR